MKQNDEKMKPDGARLFTRKFRRLEGLVTVNLQGQIYRAVNWSPSGLFLQAPAAVLTQSRAEPAELMLPCHDGVFSLAITLQPLRKTAAGWGCSFLDPTHRSTSILMAYAESAAHGFSITLEELERSGELASLDSDAIHLLEEAPRSPLAILWSRMPFKRLLFAAVFLLLILGVGSLVVPFLIERFTNRMTEGGAYLKVAESRMQTAQITLNDLDAKIRTVKSMLNPADGGESSLHVSPEQQRMLKLGLSQLENERQMVTVHAEILRSDIAAIHKGNFFFEQAVLHNYGTDSRTDPAPYLTEILTDMAASSRIEPHTPDDVNKYLLIARARVKQAEYEHKAAQVQRTALEKILARASADGQRGTLPFNSIELMQRDIALLRLDEARLQDMLTVLNDNVKAVERGNFTYETNLLQRFDPEPLRTTTPNDSALTH